MVTKQSIIVSKFTRCIDCNVGYHYYMEDGHVCDAAKPISKCIPNAYDIPKWCPLDTVGD
jgi:hypothetical protein